ncbi:MAG: DedA family protein [Parcubacteria group bacterium GW2011_GWC1_39_29]|nr:MAG: DedA family protein [Parcubacteria group bacterium GW2011_GWC1_39_29]
MKARIIDILRLVSIPLFFVGFYLIILVVWKIFRLPSDQNLINILSSYLREYGLWIVFVGALIEGFLLLGQYFPGGTVIFLGVISAGQDKYRAIEVVLIVATAFFISYTLNYLIGKYGWYNLLIKFGLRGYLDKAKEKLKKQGLNAVVFSYWEPNLASIIATAAGVLKIPLIDFLRYSFIGIVIWETFWGTLVFSMGNMALKLMGIKYVLIVFVCWVAVILIKNSLFTKKIKQSE